MSPRYILTLAAQNDLYAIGRYTLKNWGKEQFRKYMAHFESCFQQLAAEPDRGRDCEGIREGYRKISVGSHTIFYRPLNASGVEIIRILHNRMDFASWL